MASVSVFELQSSAGFSNVCIDVEFQLPSPNVCTNSCTNSLWCRALSTLCPVYTTTCLLVSWSSTNEQRRAQWPLPGCTHPGIAGEFERTLRADIDKHGRRLVPFADAARQYWFRQYPNHDRSAFRVTGVQYSLISDEVRVYCSDAPPPLPSAPPDFPPCPNISITMNRDMRLMWPGIWKYANSNVGTTNASTVRPTRVTPRAGHEARRSPAVP